MLESTGSGLDQSAGTRKRRHCGYVGDGCLTSGRGVIFPDSYRAFDENHERAELRPLLGELDLIRSASRSEVMY